MTSLKLLLLPLVMALQELNDDTFEHQTQAPQGCSASTGMTTGSWFVSFGADLDDALEAVEDDLRESYVIPATVFLGGTMLRNVSHCKDGKELWKRFGIKEPVALLFAKHKLYRYSGSKSSDDLLAFVRKALDGELQGEQIPAERSFFDKLWQRFMGQGEL
eukprot:Skav235223  [mRNA]  locus=scaffold3995:175596:177614:+ [translate_table: standard]